MGYKVVNLSLKGNTLIKGWHHAMETAQRVEAMKVANSIPSTALQTSSMARSGPDELEFSEV